MYVYLEHVKTFNQPFCCSENVTIEQNFSLKIFETSKECLFLSKMTTRIQKRKAVEQLVSIKQETLLGGNVQIENPAVETSESPKVQTENQEEINASLRKKFYQTLLKF